MGCLSAIGLIIIEFFEFVGDAVSTCAGKLTCVVILVFICLVILGVMR